MLVADWGYVTMWGAIVLLLLPLASRGQVVEYTATSHIRGGIAHLEYALQNVHVGSIPGRKDSYQLVFTLDDALVAGTSSVEASSFYTRINDTHFRDAFYIADTLFAAQTFQLGDSNIAPLGWFLKHWNEVLFCAYTETSGVLVLRNGLPGEDLPPPRCAPLAAGTAFPCADPTACTANGVQFVPGLRHVLVPPGPCPPSVEVGSLKLPLFNRAAPMTSGGVVLNITRTDSSQETGLTLYGMATPTLPLVFGWNSQAQIFLVAPAAQGRNPTRTATDYLSISASVVVIVVWITHIIAMSPKYATLNEQIVRPGLFHRGMEALGIVVGYAIVCYNVWGGDMFDWTEYSAPFMPMDWARVVVICMFVGATLSALFVLGALFPTDRHAISKTITVTEPVQNQFHARLAFTETLLMIAFIVQFVGETRLTYQQLMTTVASLLWIYNRSRDICAPIAFRVGLIAHFVLCLPYFILGGVYPLVDLTDQFSHHLLLATSTTTFGAIALGIVTGCDLDRSK